MNSRRCFAILGMLVLLSACGGEHGTGGGGSANDTLVIALMTSPTNIDARVGNDNASGRVFDLIYSGLIKVTPGVAWRSQPMYLSTLWPGSWPPSPGLAP